MNKTQASQELSPLSHWDKKRHGVTLPHKFTKKFGFHYISTISPYSNDKLHGKKYQYALNEKGKRYIQYKLSYVKGTRLAITLSTITISRLKGQQNMLGSKNKANRIQ